MGFTLLDDGYCTYYSLTRIAEYNGTRLSTPLPCRLEPGEFLYCYYRSSQLIEACQEYGKEGDLSGFLAKCRDSLGNSYSGKSFYTFEVGKSTARGDPGRGYVTPEFINARNRKRTRKIRRQLFLRSLRKHPLFRQLIYASRLYEEFR